MKKQNKNATPTIESHLKSHLILATIAFFVATTGYMVYMMIPQLKDNFNISGYYMWVISTVLLPLVLFTISYFFAPKYSTKLDKLFWTIVLTLIALFIYYVTVQFTYVLPFGWYGGESFNDSDWVKVEVVRIIIGSLPLVIYYSYVYWLRKKFVSK